VRRHAVDLSAGVLEVNSTVIRTKEQGLVIQERPKSAAGRRVLALPPSIVVALDARTTQQQSTAYGVVFPCPLRQHRGRSNTSHTFRKTVATRLDDAGISARPIADHLRQPVHRCRRMSIWGGKSSRHRRRRYSSSHREKWSCEEPTADRGPSFRGSVRRQGLEPRTR
jgi:hypothetical protein